MGKNNRGRLAGVCISSLTLSIAGTALAQPTAKVREGAEVKPTIDWSRPKLSFGAVRLDGGSVVAPARALQPIRARFFQCYVASERRGWRYEGNAEVVLALDPQGTVNDAMITSRTTIDPLLAKCWTDATRGGLFRVSSEKPPIVTVPFEFGAEHRAPAPAKITPHSGAVRVSVGNVSESGTVLADAAPNIAGWARTLRQCAPLALGANDGDVAFLRVELKINGTGSVDGAHTSGTPLAPAAVACVTRSASQLRFHSRSPGSSRLVTSIVFSKEAPRR